MKKSKVEKVMHEYKEGKLRSGAGSKVKSRKQAVAIALSEARESSPTKKSSAAKRIGMMRKQRGY